MRAPRGPLQAELSLRDRWQVATGFGRQRLGRPLIRQQAASVLASRQAIVIGPTPPGTGVIAPATARDAGEVHVADEPRLAVRARAPG